EVAPAPHERGRIEDDAIEPIARGAQELEHVGIDELPPPGREPVLLPRFPGERERRSRRIHRDDLARAAERGHDRERARIGERIEDALAGCEPAHADAALPLIEEEPRLLPVRDVDEEPCPVLLDRQACRWLLAGEHAAPAVDALLRPYPPLAALVDAPRR